jgi:phosphoribosylglycinamide formyltransferase-1
MRQKLAILISGSGTTMLEIIKAIQNDHIPIDIGCIISSNPNSLGLQKAKRLGIPAKDILIINPQNFKDESNKVDQQKFGQRILDEAQKRNVTVITQNGWLPLTPSNVIDAYSGKIFNQHPGQVPEFGGKGMFGRRVHAAVLLFTRMTKRDPHTMVIAQRVAYQFDKGTIIKSARIPILPDDTVSELQQRALIEEYRLQIELIKDIAKGNVSETNIESLSISEEEQLILEQAKELAKLLYPLG